MKNVKHTVFAIVALGLSACGSSEQVSRLAVNDAPLAVVMQAPSYTVVDVRVDVPQTLRVSEMNVLYPLADIVWRGDLFGDRYTQIAAMVDEGMTRGVSTLEGTRDVYVDIEIKRFHSLTQRARYTVGGTHSIKFIMTVRDATTGVVLGESREVKSDLKAFGGNRAIEAERRGQTQKVRIIAHLAGVIQQELAKPIAFETPVAAHTVAPIAQNAL